MIFQIFGILLLIIVRIHAENCKIEEFTKCVHQVADGYSFNITSPVELKESCEAKLSAINCVNDFISRCMALSQRQIFKATSGQKLKLVEDLCTAGTDLNRGYLSNIDCWKKIANDTLFCNEKFEKSQKAVMEGNITERLRSFYSCCGYKWHKQCKVRAAEFSCSSEARDYVENISTQLGGNVLVQLCEASFSSCYGQLYGVDGHNLDERYSREVPNRGIFFYPSILILLFMLLATSYF